MVFFVKTVVSSAVSIFSVEKCFRTKPDFVKSVHKCRNSTHLLFDFILYTEILHFAPGNILEECLKHGIRIGFSASIYYLLLKKPWFCIWCEKCILSFRKIYTLNKFSSSKEMTEKGFLLLCSPPPSCPEIHELNISVMWGFLSSYWYRYFIKQRNQGAFFFCFSGILSLVPPIVTWTFIMKNLVYSCTDMLWCTWCL